MLPSQMSFRTIINCKCILLCKHQYTFSYEGFTLYMYLYAHRWAKWMLGRYGSYGKLPDVQIAAALFTWRRAISGLNQWNMLLPFVRYTLSSTNDVNYKYRLSAEKFWIMKGQRKLNIHAFCSMYSYVQNALYNIWFGQGYTTLDWYCVIYLHVIATIFKLFI